MRAATLLGLMLFASASMAADAPNAGRLYDAPEEYVFGCTRSEARSVDLRELHRSPERFLRQCVRIEGVAANGREVYADLADVYRHTTQLIEMRTEGIGVGLYSSKLSKIEVDERARVEVIGRAFSCEELYEEAKAKVEEENKGSTPPAPPPMLGGYCHYYGNAIIFTSEERIVERGPLRLTGAEAAKAVGDLDDLAPTHELYTEVWKRVTRWFDAVRRAGTPENDDFMEGCGDIPQPTAQAAEAMRACRARRRQTLAILGTGALPLIKFYLRKSRSEYAPRGTYQAFGCVCQSATCEGQWPIHSMDIRSGPWPYFCAVVERDGMGFKVH